jgi:hypothetical protein
VRQDVQASAVRHADEDLASAVIRRVAQDDVEHRHHRIQALDAEALLAEICLVKEALQRLDADEAIEERNPVVVLHRAAMLARLDHPAQPDALLV